MLHVHRSSSGSALVDALGDLLSRPLDDPFAAEVVAVPARGIERWLAQRLSHRLGTEQGDGVCARVVFPHPDGLLDELVSQASPEHAAAVEAWQPDRVVWHLVEVLDACPAGEDWCASLVHHLGLSTDSTRRYAVARRLTGLFHTAGQARPGLLEDWAENRDDVPADLTWQPELWRRLRDRLGTHPAELLDDACVALGSRPGDRLSLYGVSRLDAGRLRVLGALSRSRDVHLFLNHASPALWEELQDAQGATKRRDAPNPARHPLLASLSRDVRELQLRLQAVADVEVHHADPDAPPSTLLQRLQHGLREDRVPASKGSTDRSVQVHSCHGRARQVEVLREVVLGLLADDPTLEPRDVLVMCPDVETFAPLIAAAFGDEEHPSGRLRVSVADRSPRQTNPLLAVTASLLELAGSRVTGTQVLDLAGAEAVRRRFGFDDDDVEQLRAWTVGSGVRWGLSAAHRAPWQMGGVAQGTWRTGLDRLLAGLATEELFGETLPYDDVDSSDVDLAGRFAELLDRVDAALDRLSGRHPVEHWLNALETSVVELADVPYDGGWQLVQLRRELDDIRAAAEGVDVQVSLADLNSLMERRLQGRPTRTSFRTGGLTVCTLTPMRSVPHRVVCLLGLDDGAFPRTSVVDGDDVLARDPHLGERDPRSEDRQLLLDAVCAAGETLVVTYSGSDPRTGAPQPPAVPLGELLDALDLTAQSPDGGSARDAVVTVHPLQPWDADGFRLGSPTRSFDPSAYEGARVAVQERHPAPPVVGPPLPERRDDVVELARLLSFWEHPAKGYLRQRLDIATASWDEEPDDALPVQLDGLQDWKVGDRVLHARLRGASPTEVLAEEAARGELPPGPLGVPVLRKVGHRVDAVVAAAAPHRQGEAQTLDVEVDLDGRTLLGSVAGVHGTTLLRTTYSTLGAKQRLRAWVELLALTVSRPDVPWRAVAVGRKGEEAVVWTAGPVPDARALLTDLVELRDLGLRTPLPLPVKTTEAYARRKRGAAISEWHSGWGYPKEDADAEHVLCWGKGAPFDVLFGWTSPLLPGTSFVDLAQRVWGPLKEAEA